MLTSIHRSSVLSAALALIFSTITYATYEAPESDTLVHFSEDMDTKIYPATFCDSNKPGSISFTQDGKAVNPSTSTAYYVTCPLIHDRMHAYDNEGVPGAIKYHFVGISVYKRSGAKIPCYVRGRAMWGESGYVLTKTITGAASNHDYRAEFSDVDASYITTIGCKLPVATGTAASTRSAVTSYHATETSVDYEDIWPY